MYELIFFLVSTTIAWALGRPTDNDNYHHLISRDRHLHHSGFRYCGPNAFYFFGKCFCEPGWEDAMPGSQVASQVADHSFPHHLSVQSAARSIPKRGPSDTINCSKPLMRIGDCSCELDSVHNRSFLSNFRWIHPMGFRCQNLCRSNSEVGVIHADLKQWKANEARNGHQVPYYRMYLPKLLEPNGRQNNHVVERLDEISEGFKSFRALEGLNFGDTIEFACGPYTQVRNIIERVNVTVKTITLLDPILDLYKEIKGTTYYNGDYVVNQTKYPATFIQRTIESWGHDMRKERTARRDASYMTFDTVVFMNAMIYSLDATHLLTTLYESLKPGGLLIFMDRWFENWVTSSTCPLWSFEIMGVQVGKPLVFQFLSKFDDQPYFSLEPTLQQKGMSIMHCGKVVDEEPGMYLAVRKLIDSPSLSNKTFAIKH